MIQGEFLMDLQGITPSDLNQRIDLLNADLTVAQASISELLKGSDPGGAPLDTTSHIRLEVLRFERNTIRSRILDATAIQHAQETAKSTRKAVSLFAEKYPSLYQEIAEELSADHSSFNPLQDESEMLIQQMEKCYRTIASSHQDQVSMMTQIQQNLSRLDEMGDWIDRVNFALTRSRSFFSRKCYSVRKLREQLAASQQDELSAKVYALIAARHGHGFVEHLHELMAQEAYLAA